MRVFLVLCCGSDATIATNVSNRDGGVAPTKSNAGHAFGGDYAELSSLYTSACRSLGACATRGGQALPDCQAKPDLHCRHIPNPGRNNELWVSSHTCI